ncbi:low-specificity L-threonine aldolase [Arcobacter sp. KX21116]|uniref:low-specificity L-threonine aldolase n=1 Tax=Arcobacter iocasae TaxID=2906515 RepID=UPI0035D4EA6E
MNKIIELRSDTFTMPSVQMKEYMFNAQVGDDVYGEDPSVNALEDKMAKLTNKEAALFTTSGTQANLLAMLSHCQRGEEYICGQDSHIFKYEGGGSSVLGGISPQPIEFEKDGTLDLNKVYKKIKPNDFHFAMTKLLCLENTHDGKVLPLSYLQEARKFTQDKNLLLHLDGARVFNAVIDLGIDIKDISVCFDSMSICISKGLGAPVGSVLVGSKEFINKARRYRKMLGGGLRQSGYLAAACSYAIDNNIKDLEKDHANAKKLALELSKIDEIRILSNDTNMVFIEVLDKNVDILINYLKNKGINISGTYEELRLVTHRDVSNEDIDYVIKTFKEFFKK